LGCYSSIKGRCLNAGGLGVLGVGIALPPFIEAQIRETRTLTDKHFGINIVMIPMALEAVYDLVSREKPSVCYCDILRADAEGSL